MEENNVEQNNVNQNNVGQNNEQKRLNACCLISFIFSMIGIFIARLPCGIIATITGIIGVATFNFDKQKGRWMGITGLVVGVIEIIVMGWYISITSM